MSTILITGGSRGIGAACVEKLAALGHRVAFLYRTSDAPAAALAQRTGALALRADVSDSEQVAQAIARCEQALGPIEALIANAGVSSFSLLQDTTDEEWRRVMGINLDGAFFCTRAVLPGMIRQKKGRIVFVSSIWGQVGASCEVTYSASKAGLIGLTRALAKEVGPSGITVNCLAPGVIETDMNRSLGAQTCASLAEETPLGRLGTAMEVAQAAAFLISEEASFITGQILGVDGGFC